MINRNFLRSLLVLALGIFFSLGTPARAELDLDFKMVSKTGYDIKAVYIGPTTSEEGGDNILEGKLTDEATLDVTFSPKAKARKWDIKCIYTGGETAEWKGLNLSEISKITLLWSEKKGSTAKVE